MPVWWEIEWLHIFRLLPSVKHSVCQYVLMSWFFSSPQSLINDTSRAVPVVSLHHTRLHYSQVYCLIAEPHIWLLSSKHFWIVSRRTDGLSSPVTLHPHSLPPPSLILFLSIFLSFSPTPAESSSRSIKYEIDSCELSHNCVIIFRLHAFDC